MNNSSRLHNNNNYSTIITTTKTAKTRRLFLNDTYNHHQKASCTRVQRRPDSFRNVVSTLINDSFRKSIADLSKKAATTIIAMTTKAMNGGHTVVAGMCYVVASQFP